MDSSKFARLVREFPFLVKVLPDEHLSAESIEDIQVRRADRNLLEVEPGGWNFDGGSFSHFGYRHFWVVSPGETIRLNDGFHKSVAYKGSCAETVGTIANQLVQFLDRDMQFIVEVSNEGYDWEEQGPTVIVYKTNNLDWRRFCRPVTL